MSRSTPLDFLRRNGLLIIGVGGFVMFWMLVYTFAVHKPSYAAKSTVIIKDSAITARLVEPEQYYAMQTTSSSSSNPVLNTMGILKSGAISNAVWLYFKQQHPEQLSKNKIKTKDEWDRFFQDGSAFIKAKNQPGTDLILLQFSWSDPKIAKEVLEVVVKAFQDASRDLNKADQISRTKFLRTQVADIEAQLAAVRRQKSEYQRKMGTVSIGQEGSSLAGNRLDLENHLNQLEAQARGKENVVRRYQKMLGMSSEKALRASALGQNTSLSRLQDELYRLEQNYSQLSASLTDTNPKVLEVQAQIEQVRANIEAERSRTMGRSNYGDAAGSVVADSTRSTMISSMLSAQSEAQDLRAQASVVRSRLAQVGGKIEKFPQIAEGLVAIEQKETSLSTALDQLRQKAMEGRLKEEQTLSNVFVVDAPRLPEKAQFPAQNHLIVLSVLMGLGTGLAVAFGKEQFTSGQAYTMPAWMEPIDEDAAQRVLSASQVQPVQQSAPIQSVPSQPQQLPHSPNPVRQPARPVPPQNGTPVAPRKQLEQTVAKTSMMSGEPSVDKVRLPQQGSLFDSLLPVAGPIAGGRNNRTQPSEPFRHDLVRPLNRNSQPSQPQAPVKPYAAPNQKQQLSVASATAQPAVTVPPQKIETVTRQVSDADLMPPVAPAAAVSSISKQNPESNGRQQPSQETSSQAITENPAVATASAQSFNAPEFDEVHSAHPGNKRSRSLPAFLIGEERTQQDLIAPPRRQLLTEEDNLLDDVEPMPAPAVESTLTAQRAPEPMFLADPARQPMKASRVRFNKHAQNSILAGKTTSSLERSMQALHPNRPR
jgi:uncharacterized protein involved in exopolysaccharide biosynthesis